MEIVKISFTESGYYYIAGIQYTVKRNLNLIRSRFPNTEIEFLMQYMIQIRFIRFKCEMQNRKLFQSQLTRNTGE